MDTEKLLRIVNDILKDETSIQTMDFIDLIRKGLSQNNPEGFSTAKTHFEELKTKIQEVSVTYTFSKTELEIASNLGDDSFFGSALITKLASFLRLQGYESINRIDKYKSERTVFIQQLQKLSESLEDLNVEEYRPDKAEIGIILPIEQGEADVVYKKIKEFEQLIKQVQELVQSTDKGVKIDRVSNGSLEFFTSQPAEVVLVVSTILANISQIWDKIATLRQKKTQTDEDKTLSDQAKTEIKDVLEKEIQAVRKEIEEKLPKDIVERFASAELDKAKKNEIRNHIKARAKIIFTWFELGIEVDIIPVRLKDESSTEEITQEIKQVTSEIRNTNQLLAKVYSLPQEVKRLPFKLDTDDVTEAVLEKTEEDTTASSEETKPKTK